MMFFLWNHEYNELYEICRRPTDQREVMAYAVNIRQIRKIRG